MGRRALRKIDPKLDLSRHYREAADLPGDFDRAVLFERTQPLEVEVGQRQGLFLVGAARNQPAHNFLGIEIGRSMPLRRRPPGQATMRQGLMICGDALLLFRQWIPAAA